MTEDKKLHAIMFPVPFQGHINPSINLVLKLASKGCAVTFIHFEHVHHRLSKAHGDGKTEVDFFEKARRSGLDVRYLTIDDGFPLEFDRNLHFDEYWEAMASDFPSRAEKFLGKILAVEDRSLAPFILADTSYSWPAKIAEKYGLVTVSFFTEPAFVLTLMYQAHALMEDGHFPCEGGTEEAITKHVPGIDARGESYLKQVFALLQSQPPLQKFLSVAVQGAKRSDFILYNTVQELEHETLTTLDYKAQSHYAVGPTNFYENLPTDSVARSLWLESDCTDWLESKPPGSVLYVSFGSLVTTKREEIEEIARGLILSGIDFVWVAREGAVGSWAGGLDGRGLVVRWCDQVRVLSSRAVGGFLTHCGWNSIIESLWFGVPMICYPITFDQPTNRKLVVEDWRVGISLCDGGSTVRREGVSEKIKWLMSGESSEGLRGRVGELKGLLRNAVGRDGSSEKNFDRFLGDLRKKIQERSLVGM